MKTIGIDTNVLLTLRLQREPQFKQVKKLFELCLDGKQKIFLPVVVLLEVEWVMRSIYKQSKGEIIEFFEELLAIDDLLVDDKAEVMQSVNLYKESTNVGFTDCVIVNEVNNKNYDLLTFDKALEKLYISLKN